MKKVFITLVCFLSISVQTYAGWGDFWNGVKKVGGAILAGAATEIGNQLVNATGDQQTIDAWNNNIKPSITTSSSYGSSAGSQLMQGDYTGAIISAVSAGAIEAGVSEQVVTLGNSGINNIMNGNVNAAIIDGTQMVGNIAGSNNIDRVCDFQRTINQINQEYRDNIRNGMSVEEASRIKYEKIGRDAGYFLYDMNEAHNDAQRAAKQRKREMLRESIMQRGYNDVEANYISSIIVASDNDANTSLSVDNILNLYHVAYKEPSSEGDFFDSDFELPTPANVDETPASPIIEQPIVVNERDNAVKLIEGTILDNYTFDATELSEAQLSELDQVAEKMSQFDDINIVIVGHTCNIGTLRANQSVGERRAKEAKYYLVSKGISSLRIDVESRDYSEPVAENNDEAHRKQNRRVTFIVK